MKTFKVKCFHTYQFIYLEFFVASNTVQIISQLVVLWEEETSTYSWSRFCTLNSRPSVSNYQLSQIRSGVCTADLRGMRRMCYHCATMALHTYPGHKYLTNLSPIKKSDILKLRMDYSQKILIVSKK